MKILIVDDHLLFAEGVQLVLELQDMECVVCDSAVGALAALDDRDFDLVLVDLNMPVTNGLDLIRQIIAGDIEATTVMISADEDLPLVAAGFEAGAKGFIPKTYRSEQLLTALTVIQKGQIYVPVELQMKIESFKSNREPPAPEISKRQLQVLELLAAGKTNRQIAEDLHISQYTAKFHVASLLELFSASNRTECVHIATQAGVITA